MIDGGGRTLMPGIIGGHEHVGLPVAPGELAAHKYDWQHLGTASVAGAKFYLDHGWKTIFSSVMLSFSSIVPVFKFNKNLRKIRR